MATSTLRGVNNTIIQTPSPSTLMEYGRAQGKVSVTIDKAVAVAQMDAGSIFKMGAKIPKGAIPLFGIMRYTGSSTATLKIGISGNDDLFGSCSSLVATPTQIFYPTEENAPLDADSEIEVLTATAAVLTGDQLEIVLLYAKA